MFSTQSDNCMPLLSTFFDIISLFAAVLEEPEIAISGKGLLAFSPLPTIFIGFHSEGIRNMEFCGKKLTLHQTTMFQTAPNW